MKTTTMIKKMDEKDRILDLSMDFAQKYASCRVNEVSGLVKQFSKQLDIILGIK